MRIAGPERYRLSFDPDSFAVSCSKGTAKFSGLAANRLPKLYVVSIEAKPIYVGVTRQPMRARLCLDSMPQDRMAITGMLGATNSTKPPWTFGRTRITRRKVRAGHRDFGGRDSFFGALCRSVAGGPNRNPLSPIHRRTPRNRCQYLALFNDARFSHCQWSTIVKQDLEKLKKDLQKLKERRVILAKELERARIRTTGRRTDSTNRNFAASLEQDLNNHDKRIAAKQAEIEKAESNGQESQGTTNSASQMSDLKEIESQLLGTGDLRQNIVRNLGSSSVAMLAIYDNGVKFVGSGSLVFVGGSHYILTAAHVWDALQSAPTLGITVTDNINHKFPIPIPAIVSTTLEPNKLEWNEWGPDLALLRIPAEQVGGIKAFQVFEHTMAPPKHLGVEALEAWVVDRSTWRTRKIHSDSCGFANLRSLCWTYTPVTRGSIRLFRF